MKFQVDGKQILELTNEQKKILEWGIKKDPISEDLPRRVKWIITHKYDELFKKFKNEWDPKLRESGVRVVPTDPDEYTKFVFSEFIDQ